ncbi:SDR family oxidoreductase [Candidatus Bathyarchaeota archaeon]|nr:SDR family oxidoreductase [Candidatus Bathyarchaeota archaeon]
MKTGSGRFSGKTVLIVNAAGSIGLAAARLFHAESANVVMNDTRGEAIVQLAELLGDRAWATNLDLLDAEAGPRLVNSVVDRFGSVDILVCNEGSSYGGNMEGITAEVWSQVMERNLTTVFHALQGVYGQFRSRGRGSVVMVSSLAARTGCAGMIDYASSMGGVLGLMKSVSREWSRWGVTCSAVCPGPIAEGDQGLNSDLRSQYAQTQVELASRNVTAEEVAKVILFLASEDGRPINGQAINVDYGLHIYSF